MNKNAIMLISQRNIRILIAIFLVLSSISHTFGKVQSQVSASAAQIGNIRVGIQAGHSQHDSGALSCDNTVREVDINEAIANRSAILLRQKGILVDVLPGLVDAVHNYTADAFVSLHVDYCAGSNSGYKVTRWKGEKGTGLDGSNDASDKLTSSLWEEYGLSTGLPQDKAPGHFAPCFIEYYALNPVDNGPICEGQDTQISGISPSTPGAIIEMGWLSGDLAYMTSDQGQNKMAEGIANAILRFLNVPSLNQASSATALVIDVSGSMGDPWMGGIKIDSAKSAANLIINMVEQESRLSVMDHEVGIASFTTDAYRLLDLTSDYNQVRNVITGLSSSSQTNIGAGIATGNDILSQASPDQKKIMILLSDGISNRGLPSDEILSGPVQDAVRAGTCIYTVGFGDAGDLNEDLLRQIASDSGCGQYYYATDVSELERVYILIRHMSTGVVLGTFTGNVSQGQTVQAGSVTVPPGQGELAITLHWPGSKMELRIQDPNNTVLPLTGPNVVLENYANLVYALIKDPIPGNWLIDVVGVEIPRPSEVFNVIISAKEALQTPVPPTPIPIQTPIVVGNPTTGFPVALLFLIIGGGGVGLYVYITVLKRKRLSKGNKFGTQNVIGTSSLTMLNGTSAGTIIPLSSVSLSIGRASSNQVQLPDPGVSRLHAMLRYSEGGWFIQDEHSRGGVYVNGQKVSAARLNHGDRILVGSTEMIYKTYKEH